MVLAGILAASLLALSADALFLPLTDGQGPEPETLLRCPLPHAPAHGSISCEYDLLGLECTATCKVGYRFADGSAAAKVSCDLFDGFTSPSVPACVSTNPFVTPIATRPPRTGNCVATAADCLNRPEGDYQYCGDCRKFAQCSVSGVFIQPCAGLASFDATLDKCVARSSTCA